MDEENLLYNCFCGLRDPREEKHISRHKLVDI